MLLRRYPVRPGVPSCWPRWTWTSPATAVYAPVVTCPQSWDRWSPAGWVPRASAAVAGSSRFQIGPLRHLGGAGGVPVQVVPCSSPPQPAAAAAGLHLRSSCSQCCSRWPCPPSTSIYYFLFGHLLLWVSLELSQHPNEMTCKHTIPHVVVQIGLRVSAFYSGHKSRNGDGRQCVTILF